MNISRKLVCQYMGIFFNFSLNSSHLHPLQVENCDSNSRLVVDGDDNCKVRLQRVKSKQLLLLAFGTTVWELIWLLLSIVGSLRDREVACSASHLQGLNFKSCVWRAVSSHSSHHPQEVLLTQFSLYLHKGSLKPDSFHLTWIWLLVSTRGSPALAFKERTSFFPAH